MYMIVFATSDCTLFLASLDRLACGDTAGPCREQAARQKTKQVASESSSCQTATERLLSIDTAGERVTSSSHSRPVVLGLQYFFNSF